MYSSYQNGIRLLTAATTTATVAASRALPAAGTGIAATVKGLNPKGKLWVKVEIL